MKTQKQSRRTKPTSSYQPDERRRWNQGMSDRRMNILATVLQVSECLRRRRFAVASHAIQNDLKEDFGIVVCLRTVNRYLNFLESVGCIDVFRSEFGEGRLWKWSKGFGLLAKLDERAVQHAATKAAAVRPVALAR